MPSQQIREILDDVRKMHRQMADCLRSVGDKSPDPRLQLLTEYMVDHEQNIDECIASYEKDENSTVLNTWLQFGADDEMLTRIGDRPFDCSMSPEQLIKAAIEIEQELLEMYQEFSTSTSVQQVQDMFESLITLEKSKGRHYARAVQEMMSG